MKQTICAAVGAAGAAVAALFGGWSAGLTTLVILMAADYATGLLAAGVFHASRKSATGGLESRAGWKGLARKCVTLLLVLSAARLELLLDVTYVRDAAVIGFCANELLSIAENAALMGVPLPRVLREALELLRRREANAPVQSVPPAGETAATPPADEGINKASPLGKTAEATPADKGANKASPWGEAVGRRPADEGINKASPSGKTAEATPADKGANKASPWGEAVGRRPTDEGDPHEGEPRKGENL